MASEFHFEREEDAWHGVDYPPYSDYQARLARARERGAVIARARANRERARTEEIADRRGVVEP